MAPKPKEKPKTSDPPTPIEDLFASLNKHIQRSEFEQAIKLADQVLSVAPLDEDAIRCKVVALIKADKIDGALSAIKALQRPNLDFSFFKAYCLYRQNKLDEALETLKGQERNSAIMLLESQILYRLGKMDACVEIYQKLQKSKIDSLEINSVAALVTAGRASEVQGTMEALRVKATSTFELAFNTACSLIDTNKYNDAFQLLQSAQRIGRETLIDENVPDDEIDIELAPIAVQLAYVKQLLGQEANEDYTSLIKRGVADELSLAVAVNNLISLKGTKDVSDGLRKFDKLKEKEAQNFQLARGLDLKLSTNQKEAIYANRILLLLHANKMDQARDLVAALPSMFPNSLKPVLLQAAVFVRENKAGKAEEILGQFAEKFPDKSKVVLLARAQIAASAGHPQVAAESLAKIPDIQHMPATVATLVSLKERACDIDGAASVLNAAIKWWSNSMTEDNNRLSVIMQEAASFMLRHGRENEASRLFEELVKSHGSTEALVGLVSTVAHVDVAKAESYEKQLKPLPGLKRVDVDALEKSSGAKHVEGVSRDVTEMYDEGKSKAKGKKKRKRKPRYPKGFDPANPGPPPDPERWLPRRERSSYRPKRKDKRAAQVRGSQGAVVRESGQASSIANNSSTSVSNSKPTQATSSNQPKPPSKSSSKSRKKSRN